MLSSAEKTNRTSTTVQQKAQQQTFFRKAGEESFFGGKEQPSFFNAPIQAKLSISSPDDPQEKEADAVADSVMRMPAPVSDTISTENEKKIDKKEDDELQARSESPTFSKRQTSSLHGIGHVNTSASLFRNTDNVPGHANEEDNNITTGYINRKATGLYHSDTIQRSGRGPPANYIQFAQSLTSSKGAGSPLPGHTRQFMESRFNADFAGVRIHTGPQANAMNKSIQAKAFAHGNDIYFKEGQHNPESPEGAKLLAHELTHTIQQGSSPQTTKNNNAEVKPVQSTDQPANDKTAISPAAPSAAKANQPGIPHNESSNQEESESPVTDQPADHINTTSEPAVPVDTGTPAGTGDNNQPGNSSSKNHTAQTRKAHGTQAGVSQKAVRNNQKGGGSEQGQTAGTTAVINERINGAKASAVKTSVVIQAAVINQDYFNTETRLDNISTIRKEQIRNIFMEANANLDAFFVRSMSTLTAAILAAQMTLIAQVNATLGAVQAFVNRMAALAFALVINTIAFVTTLIANTLAAIARTINMISSRVTGLVNSVNLPDLPGAATIRDYIRNSIYGVSRLIMVALRSVQTLIASALIVALRFLTGLIQTIRRAVSNIISNIALILTRIINTIAAAFQGVLRIAVITLQNLLQNSIHPMLANIEAMIMGTIDTLHQKALQDAMENQDQALEALAGLIGAQSGPAPGTGKPMTAAEMLAAVAAISKQATERNKEIADRFDEDTGILVSILRQRSMVLMAFILAAILGAMGAIMIRIMQLIDFIKRAIVAFAGRIIAGFLSFVANIVAALSAFVTAIGTFISHPLLSVIAFGQSVLNIIISFVANMVRRFISGLFGAGSQQAPPAVQPHVVGTGAPLPVPVITPGTLISDIRSAIISAFTSIAMAILWGFAAIITYLAETVVLAIMIGMAALLRIFLMWRFITASKPKPYPKLRPMPAVTHETKFNAPDGSPKTRNKIGVGEEVEYTGNTEADWTASGGTPLTRTHKDKFKWTAPDRAATITITFSVGGNDVSEDFEVIEPSHYTAIKDSEHTFAAGAQGAGMILNFSFHPKTVSFGNVEQMEVSGPATNISGYYLHEGMPHDHDSGDTFFAMSEDNKLAGGVRDTARQRNNPSPWETGAFDWVIPNRFKTKTESGNGKKYHDSTQSFRMADTTGKTTITKEGASVERTP